jgi:hypothetical protein
MEGHPMNSSASLVVAADGFQAVFIDEMGALNYAARCHGIVYALYRLTKAQIAWLERMPMPPKAAPAMGENA